MKALGLNHWVWVPSTTRPAKEGFNEGRSGFRVLPSPEMFAPITGVKGKPVIKDAMPFACQPSKSFFSNPWAVLPKGSWYIAERFAWLVMFRADNPQSLGRSKRSMTICD